MKKFISYILSTWLIIGFTFLVSGKALAQTNQKENRMETADSVITTSDETSPVVKGVTTVTDDQSNKLKNEMN